MKLIMNPCILILTIVAAVAVLGCRDAQNPSPTPISNPEGVSFDNPLSEKDEVLPDEVLPPVEDEDEILPDEVLPPIEDEDEILPDEVLPPVEDEDEILPDEVLPPIEDEDEVLPDEVLPPVVLGKDDRVTVKNTLEVGLRIRDAPNGKRIGGMFDGEIGTIISEGKIDRGLVWFEIEWDAPVKNPKSGCGIGKKVCIGWSVAILKDGTEVLKRLK